MSFLNVKVSQPLSSFYETPQHQQIFHQVLFFGACCWEPSLGCANVQWWFVHAARVFVSVCSHAAGVTDTMDHKSCISVWFYGTESLRRVNGELWWNTGQKISCDDGEQTQAVDAPCLRWFMASLMVREQSHELSMLLFYRGNESRCSHWQNKCVLLIRLRK